MNLIFIEEVEQISHAKRFFGTNTRIISLTPEVMYALEKEKILTSIPEDYYANSSLQEEWQAYYDLSKHLISEIDKSILERDKGDRKSVV